MSNVKLFFRRTDWQSIIYVVIIRYALQLNSLNIKTRIIPDYLKSLS